MSHPTDWKDTIEGHLADLSNAWGEIAPEQLDDPEPSDGYIFTHARLEGELDALTRRMQAFLGQYWDRP